jgi:hypothetical protein
VTGWSTAQIANRYAELALRSILEEPADADVQPLAGVRRLYARCIDETPGRWGRVPQSILDAVDTTPIVDRDAWLQWVAAHESSGRSILFSRRVVGRPRGAPYLVLSPRVFPGFFTTQDSTTVEAYRAEMEAIHVSMGLDPEGARALATAILQLETQLASLRPGWRTIPLEDLVEHGVLNPFVEFFEHDGPVSIVLMGAQWIDEMGEILARTPLDVLAAYGRWRLVTRELWAYPLDPASAKTSEIVPLAERWRTCLWTVYTRFPRTLTEAGFGSAQPPIPPWIVEIAATVGPGLGPQGQIPLVMAPPLPDRVSRVPESDDWVDAIRSIDEHWWKSLLAPRPPTVSAEAGLPLSFVAQYHSASDAVVIGPSVLFPPFRPGTAHAGASEVAVRFILAHEIGHRDPPSGDPEPLASTIRAFGQHELRPRVVNEVIADVYGATDTMAKLHNDPAASITDGIALALCSHDEREQPVRDHLDGGDRFSIIASIVPAFGERARCTPEPREAAWLRPPRSGPVPP